MIIYIPAILFLVTIPKEKGILPYGAKKESIEIIGDKTKQKITLKQAIRQLVFYLIICCAVLFTMVISESTQISTFSSEYFGMRIGMAANVYAINNIGFMIGNLMIGIIDDKIGHTGVFMFAIGLIISGQIMLTCSITG